MGRRRSTSSPVTRVGPRTGRGAQSIVRQVCRQRLSMRNEMFSAPLSEARLDEIAAGKIEPWPMPIAL